MLSFEHFTKSYGGGRPAVRDVSFSIGPGKISGLLGQNGAGKSTVLRAACALHYATSGSVHIVDDTGTSFDALRASDRFHRLTGFVPEQPVLYDRYTVLEFLRLIAPLYYTDKASCRRAVDTVIDSCSLHELLPRKIGRLSKGQRQRVSFAQALIHDPPVLILDEPSGGLDPVQVHAMHELLRKLSAAKTVLLSTHVLSEALELCGWIGVMADGMLAVQGTPDELMACGSSDTLEQTLLNYMQGLS